MISVHAVPFVRDKGLSLAVASLALTAYGVGSAIGRLAAGAVSDRFGAEATIRGAFVVQIAGLAGALAVAVAPRGASRRSWRSGSASRRPTR